MNDLTWKCVALAASASLVILCIKLTPEGAKEVLTHAVDASKVIIPAVVSKK